MWHFQGRLLLTRNCGRGRVSCLLAPTPRTHWRTAVFEFSFRNCGLRIFSIMLRNCGCFLVSGLAIARCLGECRSLRSRARLTSRRAAATGSPAVMLTASPIVSATRSATAVEGKEIIIPKEFQRRVPCGSTSPQLRYLTTGAHCNARPLFFTLDSEPATVDA